MIALTVALAGAAGLFAVTAEAAEDRWTALGAGQFGFGEQAVTLLRDRVGDLLVADSANGVFYSSNFGQTFAPRNDGLASTGVREIVADPNTPGLLYAAVIGIGDVEGGLFRSEDRGGTWAFRGHGLTNRNVTAVAVDPSEGRFMYVGTTTAVVRSVDAGANWELTNLTGVNVESLTVNPRAPDEVFAGTDKGVYLSRFRGISWNPANSGLGQNPPRVYRIAVRSAVSPVAFIATEAGLYRSASLLPEPTWALINEGLPNVPVTDIALDPLDADRLFCSISLAAPGAAVFESVNNGNNWVPLTSQGMTNRRTISLVFNGGDRRTLYVTSFGGDLYSLTLPARAPAFTPTPGNPDLNGDGRVDAEDLMIWQQTYSPDPNR